MIRFLSFVIKKLIVLIDILIHRRRIKKTLFEIKQIKIKTIYDIGANNCDYSVIFNKIFSNATVLAFEPNPYLFKEARKNTKDNKMIKVIANAVGNNNKTIEIKIEKDSPLTTSLAEINNMSNTTKVKKLLNQNNHSEIIKTKMIKIDDFIKKNKLPEFIKIDVEGYEEEVIKGMKRNLKKIKVIMVEFHFDNQYKNYNPSRLHNTLIKNNFNLYKSVKFPILNWEDRIYINKNLPNLN
jgi:FkbM family methyltransferase